MNDDRFEISGAGAPRISRKKTVLLAVIALLVAIVVALGAVFFTGTVRIGNVKISGIVVSNRIDRNTGKAVGRRNTFTDADRIYCCVGARAFDDTVFQVRWRDGNALVSSYKKSFGDLVGSSAGRFLTTAGNLAFYFNRPRDGWIPGRYTVEVMANGRKGAQTGFTIAGAKTEAKIELLTYKDPAGAYSVGYPPGWSQADPSSLGGALVGFIAPGTGSFPPRFAVVVTDYDSVSLDYLNKILEKAGAPASDMFTSFSLHDRVGARRTYTWQYGTGSSAVKLKSIQVLVKGKDHVYSLDCHCLESEYKEMLPLFNAIIDSFTVTG